MPKPSRTTVRLLLIFGLQAALTAGFVLLVRSGRMPLGVRGEWEWLRVKVPVEGWPLLFGILGATAYAIFAGFGFRAFEAGAGRARRAAWLFGLWVAAIAVQAIVQEAAPTGHGLAKWALALPNPGSNGYYTVAKSREADFDRFLVEYPEWIKTQGSLHVGTHPPGLFVEAWLWLRLVESSPELARRVNDVTPDSVDRAYKVVAETYRLSRSDRASLTLTGAFTLLCCASTCLPLYLLARRTLRPSSAWACAAAWPPATAALMFQPAADAAFPLLTTSALVLTTRGTTRGPLWSVAAGALLAVGMQASLVFLAVGLIAAIVIATDRGATVRRRVIAFFATGAGFLAATALFWWATSANPFLIWWANQRNHAGFYLAYPRTYLPWILETPIEVAAAIGFAATVWMAIGIRRAPRETLATAGVLALLMFSGRSLSEVARLWLPFFPLLHPALGAGMERLEAKGVALASTLLLAAVQTIALQILIQVVYPV